MARRPGALLGPILALLVLADGPLAAERTTPAAAGWVDISPPGDALTALVAGRGATPLLLVVHPSLGLFRSADGGRSWAAAGNDLRNPWGSTWVTALGLAADGNRVAAGTRGSGLFISEDGGRTWHPAGIGFDLSMEIITRICFDPRNPGQLLIGTNAGLFRSLDAGQSVQRVRIPTGGRPPGTVVALAYHPGDSLRAYAALEPGGLFATSDGGTTWVPAGNGLPAAPDLLAIRHETNTVALAAGPAGLSRWRGDLRRWTPAGWGLPRPPLLTALVPRPGHPGEWVAGARDGRLFASDDDGETWQRLPGPGQAGPLTLAAAESGTLFLAGGAGLHRSTDGGRSWEPINDGLPEFRTRVVVADPAHPGRMIAAGAGGVRRTENYGETWECLGSGLGPAGSSFGDMAAHPLVPSRLAGATDAGIVRSEDAGRTWWSTGLGRWTGAVSWIGPPATALVAMGIDGEIMRIWRSIDDGATWSEVTQAPFDAGAWLTTNPAGTFLAGNTLQRSDDGGLSWLPLALPAGASRVTALGAPAPGRLFCGTDAGLFSSTDRGVGWTPAGFPGQRILGLVQGGPDSTTTLLLTKEALHVSWDETANWLRVPLQKTMGGPLALALDASGRVACIAAEGGLFARELPGGRARPSRP